VESSVRFPRAWAVGACTPAASGRFPLCTPAWPIPRWDRRADVWAAGIDRPHALIPEALDALAEELRKGEGPAKVKAAVANLRLAQLPGGKQ
jgi:hypothetical protein